MVRKQDGKLIDWERNNAELRVPMSPLSYLEEEENLVAELQRLGAPASRVSRQNPQKRRTPNKKETKRKK